MAALVSWRVVDSVKPPETEAIREGHPDAADVLQAEAMWLRDVEILSLPKTPGRLGSTACQASPCPKPDWARPNCTKDAGRLRSASIKPWWTIRTTRTSPRARAERPNVKATPKMLGNGLSLCVNTNIRIREAARVALSAGMRKRLAGADLLLRDTAVPTIVHRSGGLVRAALEAQDQLDLAECMWPPTELGARPFNQRLRHTLTKSSPFFHARWRPRTIGRRRGPHCGVTPNWIQLAGTHS